MSRSLSFATVLVWCVVATLVAARHECAHDKLQGLFAKDLSRDAVVESEAAKRQRVGFQAQAPQPLRMTFSTADLSDTTKHCTRAGQVVPDFAGGSVTCTADDILSAERRNVLTNNILPAALAKLQGALRLERLTSNIVVPSDACTHFTVPSSHSSTGVANADYVLYVAAAPTSGSTLAWAGGCRTDESGRIVVGRANFGPRYLSWANASIQQENVDTAVHELLHALGFSSSSFTSQRTSRVTLRGKSATVLNMPAVTARYASYLGCASPSVIPGVELEDEGSSGSAGSHFERRVLREDLMTAAGGDKLSAMTLAVMEALGHYSVDYSAADEMTWGKGAGCGWVTSKCNTEAGGSGDWWCFDTSGANACTKDLRAVGRCAVSTYTSPLPTYFQYFSTTTLGGPRFIDGCPYVQAFSNTQCDVPRAATSNEQVFGHFYGTGGRCFATTGLIKNSFSTTSSNHQRCLESRCSASGFVQVRVDGGTWETCTATGQQLGGFSGYKGAIVCPDAAVFCPTFAAAATTTAALTTAAPSGPTPPPAPTPAPPPGVTPTPPTPAPVATPPGPTLSATPTASGDTLETKGELRFSGIGWRTIISSHRTDIDSAVRISMSLLLGIPTTTIELTRIGVGSLIVEYVINARLSAQAIDARFQEAIVATSSTAWYAEVTAVYANANPSDSTRPTSHTVDQTSLVCQFVRLDGETCYVVFVGGAICLVIFVLIILWYCCCRKKKTETAAENNERARQRRAGNDPYGDRRERSAPMRYDGAATAGPPPREMRGDRSRSRSRSGDKRKKRPPPKQ